MALAQGVWDGSLPWMPVPANCCAHPLLLVRYGRSRLRIAQLLGLQQNCAPSKKTSHSVAIGPPGLAANA